MNQHTPTTLRAGDSGPMVRVWQLHGLAARHLLREDQVNGAMDAATVAATQVYQSQRGLHPDGIVGPLTWGFAGFVGDANALRFTRTASRRKAVRFLVIHHSVTGVPAGLRDAVLLAPSSRPHAAQVDFGAQERVFDVLLGRGLSTHDLVGPFGGVLECLDPARFRAAHAGEWNDRSVGIDVCGPLDEDASSTVDDLVWQEMGTAPWASASDGRRYHRDTEACARALDAHLRERCQQFGIPYRTPGELRTLDLDPETAHPGIYAHGHLSSSRWDGYAALERMWSLGLGPERM